MLTKNVDPDKYSYSGYGIGYDAGETSCYLMVVVFTRA